MEAREAARVTVGTILACAFAGIGWTRLMAGELPHDTAAYVAAADLFVAGADPYDPRALLASPRSRGFLYIYPPLSLWFIAPLAYLSTHTLIILELALRMLCIWLIVRCIKRALDLRYETIFAIGLMCLTLYTRGDLFDGNVGTLLCAVWLLALTAWESHPRRAILFAGLAGLLYACKPLWVPVLCAGLVARGRVKACLSAASGAALGLLLSYIQQDRWQAWLDVLAFHRAYYAKDEILLELPSWLMLIPAAGWLIAALWLLVRQKRLADPHTGPPIWVWAGVAVVVWPRFGLYDLQLLFPALVWLATRWTGWRAGALACLVIAGGQALHSLHFSTPHPLTHVFFTTRIAGLAVGGVVLVALVRAQSETQRRDTATYGDSVKSALDTELL